MSLYIYTKENCSHCIQIKAKLKSNEIEYVEQVIGRDILSEDFTSLFPDVRTVPFAVLDRKPIGGTKKIEEWINDYGRTNTDDSLVPDRLKDVFKL